jgi:hypothetical protein
VVETKRWFNATQPQTLQMAVALLYILAVFSLLQGVVGGGFSLIGLAFIVGDIAGAFGIANDRKWGYRVGITFAVLTLGLLLFVIFWYRVINLQLVINAMFDIALVVLLFHPQHRDYRRIWFK